MLKTRDFSYYHNSWKFRGDEVLPGTQIDMVIERADALQNKYYLEEIDSEVTMDKLFEKE